MCFYKSKKYRLKEVKLVFSLALLILFISVSNVCGQKQKLHKKERIETTFEKSEAKKHDSLCHYEWLNDKKVFVNLQIQQLAILLKKILQNLESNLK
jgi:hypothetical protein